MDASALVVVDVQNDFLPGGTLAIHDGHRIIPGINQLVTLPFDVIVATKDWHPPNHGSFAANQGKLVGETINLSGIKQILWPTHCVQGTRGAEFAPELDASHFHKVFYKGVDSKTDSYSCFFDNGHLQTTGLDAYLKSKGVHRIYFAGLATDYCVKYSVLDAIKLGFEPYIITDVCCGIDIHADDCQQALQEMKNAGAKIIRSEDIKNELAVK